MAVCLILHMKSLLLCVLLSHFRKSISLSDPWGQTTNMSVTWNPAVGLVGITIESCHLRFFCEEIVYHW
jgi:hypothetical protein